MPGAFVDIVYDHFLANDPYEFEEGGLAEFAQNTYLQLEPFQKGFRKNSNGSFTICDTQNWLLQLPSQPMAFTIVSEGLCHRAKYIDDAEPVFEAFLNHYEELKMTYEFFFPHVKTLCISRTALPSRQLISIP